MKDQPAQAEEDLSSPAAVPHIVLRVVAAWSPDPSVPVALEHHLLDDLYFSSLRLVELAFIMEELFEMDPATMGEAPPVGTVADLCDFLRDKVVAGDAAMPEPEILDNLVASMR